MTSFSIPLNPDATFNLNLIHRIAKVIYTEVHASNNENITGLNFFIPGISILRDPPWPALTDLDNQDLNKYYVVRITDTFMLFVVLGDNAFKYLAI